MNPISPRVPALRLPALALVVGLLFAVAGIAVAGDYSIGGDGYIQHFSAAPFAYASVFLLPGGWVAGLADVGQSLGGLAGDAAVFAASAALRAFVFNSKDVPFLALFVVALYLTHRAFCRGIRGDCPAVGVCDGVFASAPAGLL